MKKVFVSMFMLAAAVSANAENSVYVIPFHCNPGDAVTAKIAIANETGLGGPSFDIHLPQGFSFNYTSKNKKPICTVLANERTSEEGEVFAFTSSSINPKVAADGHNFASVAFAGDWDAYGNDGELFSSAIKVDPSVEPGVYPIYITNYYYGSMEDLTSKNFLYDHVYISYIVVGDGGNGAVDFQGEISTTVNTALASEAAIKSLDLSAVTASYGDFTYVAGRDVVAPATSVSANVKYVAPEPAGDYASLCLPVAAAGSCFKYKNVSNGMAIFESAEEIPANEPVLIKAAVETTAASQTLTDLKKSTVTSGYYLAADGKAFKTVNGNAVIPALRGSWNIPAASNLRIAIETPTGIQVIGTADEVFGNTYDLKGRQTTNAKNGVFVVNGKKQFVK